MDLCVWFLSSSWHFFTDIYIPGTSVSFAVVGVSLLLIGIAFSLLSFITGFSIGSPGTYGSRGSKKVKVSSQRSKDDR